MRPGDYDPDAPEVKEDFAPNKEKGESGYLLRTARLVSAPRKLHHDDLTADLDPPSSMLGRVWKMKICALTRTC
jgi:hypothetical protein